MREEGVAALWKGNMPNVYRNVAMSVGMLATYDQTKQVVHQYMAPGFGATFVSSCVAGMMASVLSLPVRPARLARPARKCLGLIPPSFAGC